MRNLIRIQRKLEPLLEEGATGLWKLWETQDQRFDRLNEDWGFHCEVLLQRYGGVLNQLYLRLVESSGLAVSADQYLRTWWRFVRKDLGGLNNAQDFSSSLWTAVAAAAGRLELDPEFQPVMRLKPKFMLRQFVDEMKQRESAVALRVLAYTALSADTELVSASEEELADIVYRACVALHDTVKRFEPSLEVMTGGAIDLMESNDDVAVARRYSAWLFQS
ncbi:MAG TPA: hypothetical protein VEK57_23680 [Thermoanaerobaculia bacterium]|nr:hypothetical protein [Thermoanaerobaculia bacterium]